jgi:hypothetical protein
MYLSSIFELQTTLKDGVESISLSILAIEDRCSAHC